MRRAPLRVRFGLTRLPERVKVRVVAPMAAATALTTGRQRVPPPTAVGSCRCVVLRRVAITSEGLRCFNFCCDLACLLFLTVIRELLERSLRSLVSLLNHMVPAPAVDFHSIRTFFRRFHSLFTHEKTLFLHRRRVQRNFHSVLIF